MARGGWEEHSMDMTICKLRSGGSFGCKVVLGLHHSTCSVHSCNCFSKVKPLPWVLAYCGTTVLQLCGCLCQFSVVGVRLGDSATYGHNTRPIPSSHTLHQLELTVVTIFAIILFFYMLMLTI